MTALMADAIDNCNSKASTVSVPEVRINQLVLNDFHQSDRKNDFSKSLIQKMTKFWSITDRSDKKSRTESDVKFMPVLDWVRQTIQP